MQEILKSSHSLLDSIPATFLLTDVHSQILYANQKAESFFGYAPDKMEGQRIRILFLEEDWIYFLPNIIFLTRYKNGFDGEALLRQKDGKKIFVHLFTSAFKEKGEVFLSFVFQEIQRLKNLERERLEAERWAGLGRMVEEIAHQFRNPIASIGGYSNTAFEGGSVFPSEPVLHQPDSARDRKIRSDSAKGGGICTDSPVGLSEGKYPGGSRDRSAEFFPRSNGERGCFKVPNRRVDGRRTTFHRPGFDGPSPCPYFTK